MSILVCDSGATSAKWALTAAGVPTRCFTTAGINASQCTPGQIETSLDELRCQLAADAARVDSIFFYGAGCVGGETDRRISAVLSAAFPTAAIFVADDLLGAARAIHGRLPGVAAILGTGAACGIYDGCLIERRVPSGGYILGDEGSGASMGRELLALVCKGLLDAPLRDRFISRYPRLDYPEIVRLTYRTPGANRFLASFAPFLADNIDIPQAAAIVEGCFDAFMRRFVLPLGMDTPLGVVGSIAHSFEQQLRSVASRHGVRLLAPLKSPLERLVAYHSAESEQNIGQKYLVK